MGMRELEKAILSEARCITKKPKLKMVDILEWSTSKIQKHEGETIYKLPDIEVNISIKD